MPDIAKVCPRCGGVVDSYSLELYPTVAAARAEWWQREGAPTRVIPDGEAQAWCKCHRLAPGIPNA